MAQHVYGSGGCRFMNHQRHTIAMTPAEVSELIGAVRSVTLATILPTGHPHLVPMWFTLIDEIPAFTTYAKSQKARNLERDPRITILAEAGTEYTQLRGVQFIGTARLSNNYSEVLSVMTAAARRYIGEESVRGPGLAALEAQAHRRVAVFLDVERIISWDHRKLNGLALGDHPGFEEAELDVSLDVGDGGLAWLAGGEVAGFLGFAGAVALGAVADGGSGQEDFQQERGEGEFRLVRHPGA
jgi:PPOX class probable F420-dependent enzyme